MGQRLARGAVGFRLLIQLAAEGDPVAAGSQPWPEDRPQVELGTLSITSLVADSAAAERRLVFDPAKLVDGIELSDDQLPAVRSAVYAVSYRLSQRLNYGGGIQSWLNKNSFSRR